MEVGKRKVRSNLACASCYDINPSFDRYLRLSRTSERIVYQLQKNDEHPDICSPGEQIILVRDSLSFATFHHFSSGTFFHRGKSSSPFYEYKLNQVTTVARRSLSCKVSVEPKLRFAKRHLFF
jgi:hypothetical protein